MRKARIWKSKWFGRWMWRCPCGANSSWIPLMPSWTDTLDSALEHRRKCPQKLMLIA